MPNTRTRGKATLTLRGLLRAAPVGVAVLLIVLNLVSSWPASVRGDLPALLASGCAVDQGQNPYLRPSELGWTHDLLAGPNANPPISLLLFQPLSRADPLIAARGLWVVSLAVYVASLAVLRHRKPDIPPRRFLWALAMTAPWYTLTMGQIYILLLPLVLGASIMLESKREIAAGLLIGCLVAIKPNFVLWPALLFVAGYRRTALSGAIAALALSALPLPLYGIDVYRQWLASSEGFLTMSRVLPVDMSLLKVCNLLGLPWLAPPLDLLALLAVALRARRGTLSHAQLHAVGLGISLLLAPRAWVGYLVLLLPFSLALPWSKGSKLTAGLMLLPAPLLWIVWESHPALAWLTWVAPLILALQIVSLLALPPGVGHSTRMPEHEAPEPSCPE